MFCRIFNQCIKKEILHQKDGLSRQCELKYYIYPKLRDNWK